LIEQRRTPHEVLGSQGSKAMKAQIATRIVSGSVHPARRVFIGLLLLATAGCQSTASRPATLSDSAVTLDLPLVRQDSLYACGLASISALSKYWGVEIPEGNRASLAQTADEEKGLSGGELRDELTRNGMEVFLFQGTLDHSPTGLYHQIDAGRPPLVMLSPDGVGHHYCLVLGYDEPRRNLILLDPVRGEVLTPVAAFERNWERCQRFTLLACPREGASQVTRVPSHSANTEGVNR
jgi:hypothetical protein